MDFTFLHGFAMLMESFGNFLIIFSYLLLFVHLLIVLTLFKENFISSVHQSVLPDQLNKKLFQKCMIVSKEKSFFSEFCFFLHNPNS